MPSSILSAILHYQLLTLYPQDRAIEYFHFSITELCSIIRRGACKVLSGWGSGQTYGGQQQHQAGDALGAAAAPTRATPPPLEHPFIRAPSYYTSYYASAPDLSLRSTYYHHCALVHFLLKLRPVLRELCVTYNTS